jgi:hypothetical protein
MRLVRGRLTYANVTATVALFIALGAGAYAAGFPKDSVKSKQIKDGSVKTDELGDGSVTSPKVADGTLLGQDFAAGQLPRGAQGEQGEQGPRGLPGSDGSAGPPGPTLAVFADGLDPDSGPDGYFGPPNAVPVTTPTAGKLLAMFNNRGVSVTCSSSNPRIGLYVDRVPMPDTRQLIGSGTITSLEMFGVTAALPPGTHTHEIGYDCPGGNVTASSRSDDGDVGAVLVGV